MEAKLAAAQAAANSAGYGRGGRNRSPGAGHGRGRKRSRTPPRKRDKADQICFDWLLGKCKGGCGMRHKGSEAQVDAIKKKWNKTFGGVVYTDLKQE